MATTGWQFFIDVGGTFTDVVARRPDGSIVTHKLLSSGAVRGEIGAGSAEDRIRDTARVGEPDGLWNGYEICLRDAFDAIRTNGNRAARVVGFDGDTGVLRIDAAVCGLERSCETYELRSGEAAPVVAIRYLMGLRLDQAIGPVEVRLGTTRATNALLERKGARTAMITTKGFRDVLKIGHQDRPELFQLNIQKRQELTEVVVEIDERLLANGSVLRDLDPEAARRALEDLSETGIEAVAICLLHAHTNPVHEQCVAKIAESLGFAQVSVSSNIARLEGFVSRADTTVADAYLGPVIRGYVDSLRKAMPEAQIKLMTSTGGLVDARLVIGKDTILSGPAGGVVGCAAVARNINVDKAISFDMGGTSTDVCRVDVRSETYEYQHETVKAGVRLKSPMLAIETVAAGGGSLCWFDGHMLRVGPESAGADPGPACYGRGGPLTLTDVNLFLGRIVAEEFPFRLNRTVVQDLLTLLCEAVNHASASRLTVSELAEGYLRIANESMAAAVKRISAERGYDPREHALVAFGGAAGQHACAVADLLGITRVVCSPYAGVLSAVGIGSTDIKRVIERDVAIALVDGQDERLQALLTELQCEAYGALRAEGVAPSASISTRRTVDVRYQGQSSAITVQADSYVELRTTFESLHRQLYGYVHDNRACEVRTVRVEMVAVLPKLLWQQDSGNCLSRLSAQEESSPVGTQRSDTSMIAGGAAKRVPVYSASQLGAGASLPGPAIILLKTSTVVVDARWSATVTQTGDIELVRTIVRDDLRHTSAEADPIQLELFHRRFAAVAEQMGAILHRTALSTNVKERLDYSCAIFDSAGELVANAPHIPVHLGGMSECVKAIMRDVRDIHRGDVYVTNDPYQGGSHLNDVTAVTPVCDERDTVLYLVASRAHHAEIGGRRPGSMAPDAISLGEEGVVIRPFIYVRGGITREAELRSLLNQARYPSRAVEHNIADINAQVAANLAGVQELNRLTLLHSANVVREYMVHIREAARKKMTAALSRFREGVHCFTDSMDDGTKIHLSLTLMTDSALFDFSETDMVHAGCFNANRTIVISAILYCLRCLLNEDIPLNAGMLEPVTIILPECFLNPPRHVDPERCPAVGAGNVETSQRIVDTILGALGIVAASQGTMNNLIIGNERFGYYETICGGAGAGPGFDGADAVHTHMTNTRLTDPEVLESRYPLRVIRFEVRAGSGARGRFSGGCGVLRELEFSEPLEVSLLSQRRATAPYGCHGGENGAPGRNRLYRAASDTWEELHGVDRRDVIPGDRLLIETPGGGGWGAHSK